MPADVRSVGGGLFLGRPCRGGLHPRRRDVVGALVLSTGPRRRVRPGRFRWLRRIARRRLEAQAPIVQRVAGGAEVEEDRDVGNGEEDRRRAICYSSKALGNGLVSDLQDIVFVDPPYESPLYEPVIVTVPPLEE